MLSYHRVNGEILHRFTLYKSKYTIFELHGNHMGNIFDMWVCHFSIVWLFSWQII